MNKTRFSGLLLILFLFVNNTIKADNNFIISTKNYKTVDPKHYFYLENVGPDIPFDKLKNANWKKEFSSKSSFYNGFWVKFDVINNLETDEIGIQHFRNSEKKIFVDKGREIREFDYLKFGGEEYKFFEDGRIWFNYRISIETGKLHTIYSFFRSKPIDRIVAKSGRLDRIDIGSWDTIFFREIYRVIVTICGTLPSFIFFFLFLANYIVIRDKSYLWFSLVLLSIGFSSLYFFQFILGIRPNFFYGHILFSLIIIFLIKFLNEFLLTEKNNMVKLVSNLSIFLQVIVGIYFIFKSLSWPDGEIFHDTMKYPPDGYGAGIIPNLLQFFPAILLILYFIFLAADKWKDGDRAAKYIFFTIFLPVLILPVYASLYFLRQIESDLFYKVFGVNLTSFNTLIVVQTTSIFLVMLVPVGILTAVAERVNEFKRLSLEKQKTLNDDLENRVFLRTQELHQANSMIKNSINAASTIQSEILPKFNHFDYGFKKLKLVWEPRDIVGGDFYWVDKKDGWTCFVLADCTGHGIPGAFMTLISSTLLDRISQLNNLSNPEVVLDELDTFLEKKLNIDYSNEKNFGLDCGVCCFSPELDLMRYAGARFDLLIQKYGELTEVKGDKKSIGYFKKDHPITFKVSEFKDLKSQNFYIFSDGITDQIGGEKKLTYGKKRLKKILLSHDEIDDSITNLLEDFKLYQGHNTRRDDLSVAAFSIT